MQASSGKKINHIFSLACFACLLVFGIIFLTAAICTALQKIPDNFIETKAKIVRIDEILLPGHVTGDGDFPIDDFEYHVYVEYSYNGTTYSEKEYGNYRSSMKEGDSVLLYLNPEHPDEFICDPSGKAVFIIIGAVLTLAGIGGLGYKVIKKEK